MRLVPLGEKVIVKRMEGEASSPGGIVLPETAREKPQQGRVLSVGDGRQLPDGTRAQVQVNEGDRVLFSAYAGTEVEVDGQKLLIMDEHEILAIVLERCRGQCTAVGASTAEGGCPGGFGKVQ